MFGKKKEKEIIEKYEEENEKNQKKDLFKKYKENTEVAALITIFVGIIFMVFPAVTTAVLGYTLGTVAIIAGIIFVAKYIKKDVREDYYSHELVMGLCLMIIGILVYIKVDIIGDIFKPVFGLFILYSGVEKLQTAIDLVRMKYENWKLVLVLAIVNIVFGIILLLNFKFGMVIAFILIGIGLIFSGISSLVASHFFQKGIKKVEKEKK